MGRELTEKVRYVHANPVTRGLVPNSTPSRWSSAAAYRALPGNIGPPPVFDLLPDHRDDLTWRPTPAAGLHHNSNLRLSRCHSGRRRLLPRGTRPYKMVH